MDRYCLGVTHRSEEVSQATNTTTVTPSFPTFQPFDHNFSDPCDSGFNLTANCGTNSTYIIQWPALLTLTASEIQEIQMLCEVLVISTKTLAVLAFTLGIPGNLLAGLVFLKMPRNASALYLLCMTVGDFLSLLLKLVEYICGELGTCTFYWNPWFSDSVAFIGVFPNWLLAFICVERMVAVCFPFYSKRLFTLWRAQISVIVLALVLALITMIAILTMEGRSNEENWIMTNQSLYLFVPSIAIIISTSLTVQQMWKVTRRRKQMTNVNTSRRLSQTERSLVTLMLVAAISFILLMLPMFILRIVYINIFDPLMNPIEAQQLYTMSLVALHLTLLPHSINFYLYLVSAPGFRRQLVQLFTVQKTPVNSEEANQATNGFPRTLANQSTHDQRSSQPISLLSNQSNIDQLTGQPTSMFVNQSTNFM